MLLLDFQRYYIWLKVYYTGTFGQPVAGTMALVLLLLYHHPAPDNTFIDSGKGAVE